MASSTNGTKNEFTQKFMESFNTWKTDSLDKNVTDNEKDRVGSDSKLPDHTIFGFENENKSMENFLLDQKVYKKFKTLVIVGEYGVGKTTLCQKIFNNEVVKSTYSPRIWISMESKERKEGENEENKKIGLCKKILKELGVNEDMFESIHKEAIEEANNNKEARIEDGETAEIKELSALLYVLHLNLRWKKYLIVFDDIREEDEWAEILDDDLEKLKENKKWGKYISDGFPKGSGGRVIYTTRDHELGKKLVSKEHEIHVLWPLSDYVKVWEIYKEAFEAKGIKEAPRNDKKCIDELMNKSRGLPLAVRSMAKLDPVFLDDEGFVDGPINGSTVPTDPANQTGP